MCYYKYLMLNANFQNFLQCCSCTFYFKGEIAHFWDARLCSMCCWFNHNCSTCSSRTCDRICCGSLGSCNGARLILLKTNSEIPHTWILSCCCSIGVDEFPTKKTQIERGEILMKWRKP